MSKRIVITLLVDDHVHPRELAQEIVNNNDVVAAAKVEYPDTTIDYAYPDESNVHEQFHLMVRLG